MKKVVLLVCWLWSATSAGEVLVFDSTVTVTLASFRSVSASFGKPLPPKGLHAKALKGEPIDGCHKIQPPPLVDGNFFDEKLQFVAVLSRYGGCTFEQKVRNAQESNYSGVIVFNINSDKVIPMGGDDPSLIPSVFIGYSDGDALLSHYTYSIDHSFQLVITDDEPFDVTTYLLPFAIVVGICFLIMLGIVIFKCGQDYRRNQRNRLPKTALHKLPIHKFKYGDPFETCCICLDDFVKGDKLRVLPCSHGYHSRCIDPWLVKNKRICPQCRRKVFVSNDRVASLSNESDIEDDERVPLLSDTSGSYGGISVAASSQIMPTTPPAQPHNSFPPFRRGRLARNVPVPSTSRGVERLPYTYEETSDSSTSDDDDDQSSDSNRRGRSGHVVLAEVKVEAAVPALCSHDGDDPHVAEYRIAGGNDSSSLLEETAGASPSHDFKAANA